MDGEGEDNDRYTEKSFALETRSFASETNAVPRKFVCPSLDFQGGTNITISLLTIHRGGLAPGPPQPGARACLRVWGWHLWPVYRAVEASAGALYWTEINVLLSVTIVACG